MTNKEIFERAYELMDEPIIDSNCGLMCDFHCCRDNDKTGEELGIYLIPTEYEAIYEGNENLRFRKVEKHEHKDYFIPEEVGELYYMYCDGAMNCPRDLRPIHCRTYPLEPQIENGELFLVIEKSQIHSCPLLEKEDLWRDEYIKGIYKAWKLLISIKEIKKYVKYESDERIRYNNIKKYIDLDLNEL